MCFFRPLKIVMNWLYPILPFKPKKIPVFNIKHWILPFLKFSKKIIFFWCFFTKTTVLTSILTSEVTDIAPQPQSELGDMLGTQSGTWGNLVQHMCKSQQTTSVKVTTKNTGF